MKFTKHIRRYGRISCSVTGAYLIYCCNIFMRFMVVTVPHQGPQQERITTVKKGALEVSHYNKSYRFLLMILYWYNQSSFLCKTEN